MLWLTNDPQWSDWGTQELGFADAPQAIVCRHCHKALPTKPLFFRQQKNALGFDTICRTCDASDSYRRRFSVSAKLIMKDPSIPDALKEQGLTAHIQANRERLKKLRKQEADVIFKFRWTIVRNIIAARKAKLVNCLDQSKSQYRRGRQSGLAYAMANSQVVADYIDALFAMYAGVIGRMRNMREWHFIIGEHYPPTHWNDEISRVALYDKGGLRTEGKYELHLIERINPVLLAWDTERRRLIATDPLNKEPVDPHWVNVLSARENGTLKHHLYPERYPENSPSLYDQTPDWLRPFNGYEKPKGNP